MIEFCSAFTALTGNLPFPWQEEMYRLFSLGKIPPSCSLPTGLGKTSVIAIWLIARANYPTLMPRRLVYVVNRRTVVDQCTEEVKKLRERLRTPENHGAHAAILREIASALNALNSKDPLAISTLRGQFADNREWSADPSRPAVICGTVDMIGSRLLFSGYGVGFKSKPLHAGFLGQDVLLVHDEAHLEPAFQKLLVAIEKEQKRCEEFGKFRVMELTATSRQDKNESVTAETFELTEAEKSPPLVIPEPPTEPIHVVWQRQNAKKTIWLIQSKDEKKLGEEIAALALKHDGSGRAVLIYVRRVEDVEKIVKKLPKSSTEQLTGTLRGKERDELVEKPVFRRFLPGAGAGTETVYLVSTSAGEVGVNISGDHLVCDLSTFESMAQRFGRVNRFGERTDTEIHVVHPPLLPSDEDEAAEKKKEKAKQNPQIFVDAARRRTLELLRALAVDASPRALDTIPQNARLAAFIPQPDMLATSSILLDAWALTTIREKLPGRPSVEPYLHGISEWEPPETHVAWREEVHIITHNMREEYHPDDLLESYPLKPHELLRDRSDRVFKHLLSLAERRPDEPVWLIDEGGNVVVLTMKELADKDKKDRINFKTVLLSPGIGGLEGGLLNGSSAVAADDVADKWFLDAERRETRRIRLWDDDPEPADFRLIRELVIKDPADEDAEPRRWRWFVRPRSADDDGSKTSKMAIPWKAHTDDVERGAKKLADALLQDRPDLHKALILAARFHDLGKKRVVWQKSIGNPTPLDWHAKSGKDPKTGIVWKPLELSQYRHEFGSLIDLENELEFQLLTHEQKELVRHLIAVHHGYGRPYFPPSEAFDPERSQSVATKTAAEVPRRFAQLQRKYGRWGLAFLESLLRAADWAASAKPSQEDKT